MISKRTPLFIIGLFSLLSAASAQGQALDWLTYWGGTELDDGRDVAIDQAGNAYLIGRTQGLLPFVSPNADQSEPHGDGDAYLAKFDPAGNLVWATYLSGEDNDLGNKVVVGPSGNLFVMLTTSSEEYLSTAGVYQSEYGGGFSDVLVACFTPAGEKLWATYLGGSNNDLGFGLAVDEQENVYVTGRTKSFDRIASVDAFQESIAGDIDAFLFKLDRLGQLHWSTYFGGNRVDIGVEVVVDDQERIYLAGWTASSDGFSTGVNQSTYGGGQSDMFLARFAPDGDRDWCTYFGGVNNDYGNGLAIDPEGNILITGSSFSPENIGTAGTHQPGSDGSGDAVLAKFSNAGQQLWGTYFGGDSPDVFSELAVSQNGTIYVSGYTRSPDNIATDCSLQESFGGSSWDGIMAQFTPNGQLQYATYLGAAGDDQAFNIALAPDDQSLYMTGISKSAIGLTTTDAHQPVYGGGDGDGILAKLDLCVSPEIRLIDGGYHCQENPENLEIEMLAGHCTEIQYTLDGLLQAPLRITAGRQTYPLPPGDWSRLEIIAIGNEDCPGSVAGVEFIELVSSTLSPGQIVQICDSASQTYRVIFRMNGGSGEYINLNALGEFSGDRFTSFPIEFGLPYSFSISSTAGCETLIINGHFECTPACEPLTLDLPTRIDACAGEPLQIGPLPGEDFRWSGPDQSATNASEFYLPAVGSVHQGDYQLVIGHGLVCSDTFHFNLRVHRPPLIDWDFLRAPDCRDQTADIYLLAGQSNLLYSLDGRPFTADSSWLGLTADEHTFRAQDEFGCSSELIAGWSAALCPLYGPTAFSPNDDGINDRFQLFASPDLRAQVKLLAVYDRWGGVVFEAREFALGEASAWWDGRLADGQPATMGSYVWVAELTTAAGEEIQQAGLVNLLR